MQSPVRYLNAGDTALIVEFGNDIDKALVDAVNALREHVKQLHKQGHLPGLQETIPTFRSLAIVIDPLVISVDEVKATLQNHPVSAQQNTSTSSNAWRLPVCYGSDFGPDVESVAKATHLSTDEVIASHLRQTYQVYLLGFQPGYGFLGDTDPRLHLPRRTEPRIRVPAGSVAIAMKLTCVYPWDCPGGWHLLGRCPLPMFNAQADRPTMLSPNDTVTFESIDANAFNALEKDRINGVIQWSSWLNHSSP